MVYRSSIVMNLDLDTSVYLVVFFSTLFVYSIHGIASVDKGHIERDIWNQRNQGLLYFFSVPSAIGLLYFLLINPAYLLFLSPVVLLTSYYIFPRLKLFAFSNTRVYFKTVILAVVWVFSTSVFPVLASGDELWSQRNISFFAVELIFLYLICFFFDHRDRRTDPQQYVFFDPHQYPSNVVFAAAFLFSLAIFFGILTNVAHHYLFLKSIFMLFLVLTYKKSISTQSDLWFYLILDGLMGADSLLCWTR